MGPFETEPQTWEAIGLPDWEPGTYKPRAETVLLDACTAAGVQLGAYDRRIVAWLADGEPQTAAVIAGLISRAGQGEDR